MKTFDVNFTLTLPFVIQKVEADSVFDAAQIIYKLTNKNLDGLLKLYKHKVCFVLNDIKENQAGK